MSSTQGDTAGQGVGSPIGNDAYNVITALQAKLEGMEAYRKYHENDSGGPLWQQLNDLDRQAVRLLSLELDRMMRMGQLRVDASGQVAPAHAASNTSVSSPD